MTTDHTDNNEPILKPRLLPCPLLGHAPSKDEWPTGPYIAVSGAPDMPKFYAIVCPGCCSTAYDEDKERVIRKWNSRVPASAVPMVDESGWLLEKMHDGSVHYIAADYVLQWTDDPNKALRLSRREDAEALTSIVEDCEKIASHEWPATAATAAPAVRGLYSRLVQLAAAVIAGHDFISPDADDNPKSTPRAILDQAEKQKEQLRVWAIEIREVADALIATTAPAEQSELVEKFRTAITDYCLQGQTTLRTPKETADAIIAEVLNG